jgi:hypothetical protein
VRHELFRPSSPRTCFGTQFSLKFNNSGLLLNEVFNRGFTHVTFGFGFGIGIGILYIHTLIKYNHIINENNTIYNKICLQNQ